VKGLGGDGVAMGASTVWGWVNGGGGEEGGGTKGLVPWIEGRGAVDEGGGAKGLVPTGGETEDVAAEECGVVG
jgi:hypothetical protein